MREKMQDHFSFALSVSTAAQAWQLIPLYREIKKRGHDIDFFACTDKISTLVPLNHEGIDWLPRESVDGIECAYDVVIENHYNLSEIALKPSGLSLGLYGGGVGNWLGASNVLYSFPLFNFWVGQNDYERLIRRMEGFDAPFPIIGMPSIDLLSVVNHQSKKIKGLYFNGPPFLPNSKEKFNTFLIELARNNPHLEIVIKHRFFHKDEGTHFPLTSLTHAGCQNIRLVDGSANPFKLIEEADFLMGLATTAFLEALYLQKPIFIIEDFDNEYYVGHRASETYSAYLLGMNKVLSNDLIYDFDACFQDAHTLPKDLYRYFFPFDNPSSHIIDMLELTLRLGRGKSLKYLNFNLNYRDQESFTKEASQLIESYFANPFEFIRRREKQVMRLKILMNALFRIKYVIPRLPNEIYRRFVHEVDSKCQNLQEGPIVDQICVNIGSILYQYLNQNGWLKVEWLPQERSLFEFGSTHILAEGLYLFNQMKNTQMFDVFYSILKESHCEAITLFQTIEKANTLK